MIRNITPSLGLKMAALFAGFVMWTSAAQAQEGHQHANDPVLRSLDAVYPLSVDPVASATLVAVADQVKLEHDGRELRFNSAANAEAFKADPKPHLERVDALIVATQAKEYPIDTCVISGEKLGGMGEPVNYVHQNRLVRFCCAMCIDEFKKEPENHLAKLNAQIAEKERATFPMQTCVVMTGDKLGGVGESTEIIFANRLVRFCCTDCVESFKKDPLPYVAKIEAARKAQDPAAMVTPAPAGNVHLH